MSYLNNFRKTKGFDKKLDLRPIQVALESAAEAFEIASTLNASVVNENEQDTLIRRTHYILLSRTYQHIEGMLSCIASGDYSSAEAIGRVVNESSINLIFMVLKGDERTITAYFAKWYKEHTDQLNKWKEHLEGETHKEKVSKMIDRRLEALSLYKEYTEQLKSTHSVEEKEYNSLWYNSVHKRFSELGRFEEYVEVYHRLSGASHITAEDTMSALISEPMPDGFKKLVEFESNSYSIMMSRIVITSFLDAGANFCIRHGLTDSTTLERFLHLKNVLNRSVKDIAQDAGVPSKNETERRARLQELTKRLGVII
ncbi:DUF5677 domain-containing protein [Vibrio coralliirubri]|uniref:DUF5677 domain-containing protein n=1 Tax=Vibrio coralliirubri TaxID=1516159 RepID=UPI0006335177|nr:DUF5677 domain-containing protein [Vibrio coralliirubri]CDT85925.1 hypothetical protein VCR8J2_240474 [Vibrio coralliirubri]